MSERVVLRDTETGQTVTIEEAERPWGEFWWTDGNGGCDCNRATYFFGPDHDIKCNVHENRFVIVEADFPDDERP